MWETVDDSLASLIVAQVRLAFNDERKAFL
jgi:hypothetical protein